MLTLTGILKNVLLIFASVLIWHTHITGLQWIGYPLAIGGLLVYSETVKWDHVASFAAWAKGAVESGALDENRLPPSVRRIVIVAAVALITIMLFVGWSHPRSTP